MGRPTKYPWDKIKVDLEIGMQLSKIHKKYDVPYNSINQYIKKNNIIINEQAKSLIEGYNVINEGISELNAKKPKHAQAILDLVKEHFPLLKPTAQLLSTNLLKRMNVLVKTADPLGVNQLAKGMQTVTDTWGITQRHASINLQQNTQVNNQMVEVVAGSSDENI